MHERWWLAEGARTALGPLLDEHVPAWMARAAQGTCLSSDRNSAVVRLDAPAPMIIKWRRPRPGRGRRTWLRPSRELREARATRKLATLGIKAPPVWAVGERRNWGLLLGSVLLRPWVADARDLRDASVEDLARGGAALRRWHDAGFRHGDAYPKNVLLTNEGEHMPLGFPAARFVRPGQTTDPARLKDLAQWIVGVRMAHPEVSPERAVERYAAASEGPSAAAWCAVTDDVRARIEAKKAERARTRAAREPEGPPRPVPLPTAEPMSPLRSERML